MKGVCRNKCTKILLPFYLPRIELFSRLLAATKAEVAEEARGLEEERKEVAREREELEGDRRRMLMGVSLPESSLSNAVYIRICTPQVKALKNTLQKYR